MTKLQKKSDYFSKFLLSDKELLWYLMKCCIEEYKDLSKLLKITGIYCISHNVCVLV